MQDPVDDDHDDESAGAGTAGGAGRTWVHPSEVGMVQRGRIDRRRGTLAAVGLVVTGVGLLLGGMLVGLGNGTSASGHRTVSALRSMTPSLASLTVVSPAGRTTATGVVLDTQGHIAVRASSLADATEIWATCGDRQPQSVETVATDAASDVTVLRLPTPAGRAAIPGESPRLGQEVVVVRAGSGEEPPESWTDSVNSAGLVHVRSDGSVTKGLFQTSRGNGERPDGAVFDERGRLLGLVLGTTDGRLTALPGHRLVALARALVADGSVSRPWIGLETVDLPRDAALHLGLAGGATILTIVPGGPADAAGLQPGDIVVAVGDLAIHRMVDLATSLQQQPVGSVALVTMIRDGQRHSVAVTTKPPPALHDAPTTTLAAVSP